MASPDKLSVDLPILTFGGRVTQFDAQQLPVGASPFCQDNNFSGPSNGGEGTVAGVGTRYGLGTGFYASPFSGNPTVNYIKAFTDNSLVQKLLSIDGLGIFRAESPSPQPPGIPLSISRGLPGAVFQSDPLFGREWIATSSAIPPAFGLDIPRQTDGTYFDRVSQGGPGAPPIAADEIAVTFNISGSPNGLAQPSQTPVPLSEVGNTVTAQIGVGSVLTAIMNALAAGIEVQAVVSSTAQASYDGTFVVSGANAGGSITMINPISGIANAADGLITYSLITVVLTPAATPYPVGQLVTIAGATVGSYDVTGTVLYNDPGAAFFYISGNATGLSASGGGTITAAGSIAAGLHQVAVSFVINHGYITEPSPFGSWNSAGGVRVVLSSIPTGPSNVVARIVMFTGTVIPPAVDGSFFYLDGPVPTSTLGTFPSMVIQDNTTTTATFDFSDAVLEAGTSSDNLFDLVVLGECSSVTAYSGRTFWCGERNKLQNLINMAFDGGWQNVGVGQDVPLGWYRDPTYGAGGGKSVNGYWQDGYLLSGDGATVNRGMIQQGVYQDQFGVNILNQSAAYSYRVRLEVAVAGTGNFTVEIFSPTVGSLGTGNIAINTVPVGGFTEFIVPLMIAQTVIPADAVVRVYLSGTPSNTTVVLADELELFPTNTPYNTNIIRSSYAEDPESFNGVTGLLQMGQATNQAVRRLFTLADNKLYIVTDRGMFVTQDDGQNEPSQWVINVVSTTVGTGSANGVALGEAWAVIASHDGPYIFWGSEPVKIGAEIQPDWDQISWQYACRIYSIVDTENKRIIFGVPYLGTTQPLLELVCDYSQLANSEGSAAAQDIASHPQAYYSVYNPTKVVAPGKARKWTIWNIAANCGTLALRSDGSYHLLRGNNIGNGKIYDQQVNQFTDDGVVINFQYQTAFIPQVEDEQALQLGSHRKLFKYLTGFIYGRGTVFFNVFGAMDQQGVALSNLTLTTGISQWDFEKNVNWVGERFSIFISTGSINTWFVISKLIPTIQREIVTPVRGNS